MRFTSSVQGPHGLISESRDMAELLTPLLPQASLVILAKATTLVGFFWRQVRQDAPLTFQRPNFHKLGSQKH